MLLWKAVISTKMGIRLLKPLQCLKQMGLGGGRGGVELRFGPANSIREKLSQRAIGQPQRSGTKTDSTNRLMLKKSTNTGKLPT